MPPILDVAIGTVFVFLLFSLVVSALNEVILSYFDQRAKFLRMGLQELLGTSTAAPKSGLGRLIASISLPIWKGIKHFFVAPTSDPNDLVQTLCGHGPINALSRSDKGNAPSYIPAGAFVTSLLDLLIKGTFNAPAAAPPVVAPPVVAPPAAAPVAPVNLSTSTIPDELTAAINNLPAGRLKESLSSLLAVAGKDLGVFKTALEGWFNDAMDRVSGWYKRFAQNWMIVIGFVLAVILNVDTLRIVQTLSSNPNLAKAVAAQAASYVKNSPSPAPISTGDEDRKKALTEATKDEQKAVDDAAKLLEKETDATKKADDQAALDKANKLLESKKEDFSKKASDTATADFKASIAKLKDTGIPIGWDKEQLKSLGLDGVKVTLGQILLEIVKFWHWLWHIQTFLGWFSSHLGAIASLLPGWLLTAFAASLGAPFWFDILGRIINIRNAGKAPNEKDPTASANTADPKSMNATPHIPDAAPANASDPKSMNATPRIPGAAPA